MEISFFGSGGCAYDTGHGGGAAGRKGPLMRRDPELSASGMAKRPTQRRNGMAGNRRGQTRFNAPSIEETYVNKRCLPLSASRLRCNEPRARGAPHLNDELLEKEGGRQGPRSFVLFC